MRVDVALTPPQSPPRGLTCLVVDVLRATSVLAVLFGRGVRRVYPCASVDEARQRRAALASRGVEALLCGEVDARPPEGFDRGNSPGEFEAAPPRDVVVMATTNGTPALLACIAATLTMPASPLNAGAVTRRAVTVGLDTLVVCAGLRGGRAEDDALAAGLLVSRLVRAGAEPGREATRALAQYEAVADDLAGALARTEHGARLVQLGFGDDVHLCALEDRYDAAARLTFEDGVAVLEGWRG